MLLVCIFFLIIFRFIILSNLQGSALTVSLLVKNMRLQVAYQTCLARGGVTNDLDKSEDLVTALVIILP